MEITNKIINNAIEYIFDNLTSELGVDSVASYCNISKFHFSRLFKKSTGESIYSLIKRLKMEDSAIVLGTNTGNSITDIGLGYGYSSSNYSSAFTKHHGISPAKFRKLKKDKKFDLVNYFDGKDIVYQDFEYYNKNVVIRELEDIRVIYRRYIGDYGDLIHHWPKFIDEHRSLVQDDSQLIDVCYSDPNITDKKRCIYDICIILDSDTRLPPHITTDTRIIKGGKFASYSSKGNPSVIAHEYKGVFNVWLPNSGYSLDNRIRFDSYKVVKPDEPYFEVDINLPIQ
ncbi:GyrI-like domain-containing protein [Vibrio tapetis subsp. quintayensis]|uniref:AraC family transcriptional regulator n=1 Tax=Vibrio tapetis TaxID=52443 RepID=UPI0025B2DAF1|nr:GyrI-like domain-containing protein [Vibrio tapetis]MDN3680886.1 GyrI-like domain-containing protein [Vibrio tapetis subsp. quintayensis]